MLKCKIVLCAVILALSCCLYACDKNPVRQQDASNSSVLVISDAQIWVNNSAIDRKYRDNVFKAIRYGVDKKVSAIVMVGDMVNDSSEAAYDAFQKIVALALGGVDKKPILIYSPGNHEMLSPVGQDFSRDELFERFTYYTESAVDSYQVVEGTPIISLASCDGAVMDNTAETLAFLSEKIKVAAEIADGAPILVANHAPILNTVQGSYKLNASISSEKITEILKPYPNVIYLSGHSHYPLLDERNIWQKDFTAYNTGTMSYMSLGGDSAGGDVSLNSAGIVFDNVEKGAWSPFDNLITKADKYGNFGTVIGFFDDRVEIAPVNFNTSAKIGQPLVLGVKPAVENFTFTQSRSETSTAPLFESASMGNLVKTDGKYKVRFLDARHSIAAESYLVSLYKGSEVIAKKCIVSDYYTGNFGKASYEVIFEMAQSNDEYTAEVTPYNCWGKAGEPLKLSIHVSN